MGGGLVKANTIETGKYEGRPEIWKGFQRLKLTLKPVVRLTKAPRPALL